MKKGIIVYSSNTGNTKLVAEAMYQRMPDFFDIVDMKEDPDVSAYEVVVIGYWVDRGAPNQACVPFMKKVTNKNIIFFQTVGAEPTSFHAMRCTANAGTYLGDNCKILGVYSCRGQLSSAVVEKMKSLPNGALHAISEENLKRWAASEGHPDKADLAHAGDFLAHTMMMYERFHRQENFLK